MKCVIHARIMTTPKGLVSFIMLTWNGMNGAIPMRKLRNDNPIWYVSVGSIPTLGTKAIMPNNLNTFRIMIAELSGLTKKTLDEMLHVVCEATTELKGDMEFGEAMNNEAFRNLTFLQLQVFEAIKTKHMATKN